MASASAVPASPLTLGERLDRLPWSRWHLRLVVALGIAWLLDGLEGSLAGSLAGALKATHGGLGLSDADLGVSSTVYLVGGVLGALIFGFLADRFGRKRLFLITLLMYLLATSLTAVSWDLWSFTFCRFFTGAGIGGEYAAINSAIDELIPARVRGQVNLAINGSFWLGIVIGSIVSSLLLSSAAAAGWGWRFAFLLGLPVGFVVLQLRRHIPESPRWLKAHGRSVEATAIVSAMESETPRSAMPDGDLQTLVAEPTLETARDTHAALWQALVRSPRRALVCLVLMTAQAFCYNSVFFSLSLVLLRYDHVAVDKVGYAYLPIALSNFAGPLLFGQPMDKLGRKPIIAMSYVLAGLFLFGDGLLLLDPRFGAPLHIFGWAAVFVFGSTAASAAYLTVSELFPQNVRALAVAIFYAFGTLLGGVSGPFIFGRLVGSGSRFALFEGYLLAAALMGAAGIIQAIWGTAAERRSLESLQES